MFSLIAAVDSKMGIGKNGTLPWHLPSDLKYYHRITTGNGKNAVIMGRLTWESIPAKYRPLKNRKNIVITTHADYEVPAGVLCVDSLDKALAPQSGASVPEEIFVIGGGQIFAEAINHPDCKKIYITEIDGDFRCDAFFPPIDRKKFKKVSVSETQKENDISFRFVIWKKAP